MPTHQRSLHVAFRPATLADISALTRLIRRYYALDHIRFNAAAIGAGLKAMLGDASLGQVFLAVTQSNPIGYAILTYGFDLEFGGRVALMTDLYLEPKYRRQGIGRRAIGFLERFCRKQGIKTLELQVEHENYPAWCFYRRCGFQAHVRIPMSKHLGR